MSQNKPEIKFSPLEIEVDSGTKYFRKQPQCDRLQKLCSQKNVIVLINVFSVCIIIISLLYMKDSIIDCPYDKQEGCARYINEFVKKYIPSYMFIGFLFSLILFLAYNKLVYRWLGITTIIVLIYAVGFYDTKISMKHYGGAITTLLGIFTVMWLVIILLMIGIVELFKRSRIIFLGSILIVGFSVREVFNSSCYGWDEGFFNMKIDQSDEFCQVIQPDICYVSIFDHFMDISPFIINCQNSDGLMNLYMNYYENIDKNQRYLAFQNTNLFLEKERICQLHKKNDFQFSNFKYARSVDDPAQALDQGTQIILDLQEMNYIIEIKRNDTLVQQRIEMMKNTQEITESEPDKSMSRKILVIYVDAMSRAQFHRQMPKTRAWVENRQKKNQAQTVQFFRMYSLKPYTYPNFMAFQFECYATDANFRGGNRYPCAGNTLTLQQNIPDVIDEINHIDLSKYDQQCVEENLDFVDSKQYYHQYDPVEDEYVWNRFRIKERSFYKNLQQNGYVIGRSIDTCLSNMATIGKDTPHFYYDDPADHEGVAFACDPNYQDPYYMYGLFNGPFSLVKRCLNGKMMNQYVLQYGKQFWQQYRNDKAFLMLEFIDAHEPSGVVLTYLDQPLSAFLQEMEAKGLMDDTLVVFLSDHGNHMHLAKTMLYMQQFYTERMFPLFVASLPQSFVSQYPDFALNMKLNQQKLYSHQNSHFFMQTVIQGEGYQNADQSFFNLEYKPGQKCEDIVMDWEDMVSDYSYREVCVCIAPGALYPDPQWEGFQQKES